jgi:hypothetical protein
LPFGRFSTFGGGVGSTSQALAASLKVSRSFIVGEDGLLITFGEDGGLLVNDVGEMLVYSDIIVFVLKDGFVTKLFKNFCRLISTLYSHKATIRINLYFWLVICVIFPSCNIGVLCFL